MSVLFGGNLADELAESVRKYKEEFDSIDINTHFKKNQWKSRSAEIIAQQKQQNDDHKIEQISSLSKPSENNDNAQEEDLNAFIETDDSEDDDANDHDHKDSSDDVEYLDVRQQTIFRLSKKPKISYFDKHKNAKKSSLQYIQNNNVRTSFKNVANKKKKAMDEDTFYKKDPFMDQKLLRQNFVIDRKRKDFSMIKDKTRIQKLARHNMQFMKEVLNASKFQKVQTKKTLLFNKGKFNRRLRFTLGAPNKRRQTNYKEFQRVMVNRQSDHEKRKDLYLERGLRVQTKLNDKVMFHKYGRAKIWNAGRTKSKKGKRKTGKVGGYEFAKNVNEW